MRKIMNDIISYGSCFFAGVYSAICSSNSVLAVTTKVTSTALLTVLGARAIPAEKNMLATTSLFFHCLGDLLIETASKPIECAIPVFLVGHVFYVCLLNQNRMAFSELSRRRILMMLILTTYSAAFTQRLVSETEGVVQCAIPVYVATLTMMFLLASMQKTQSSQFFLGALMYIASDNLIGAREFLSFKCFGLNQLTWGLYYMGQRTLLHALIRSNDDKKCLIKN